MSESVAVELFRRDGNGVEGCMVHVNDDPDLKVGAVLTIDDDPTEWTVTSVHRCAPCDDGTLDHSRCFL